MIKSKNTNTRMPIPRIDFDKTAKRSNRRISMGFEASPKNDALAQRTSKKRSQRQLKHCANIKQSQISEDFDGTLRNKYANTSLASILCSSSAAIGSRSRSVLSMTIIKHYMNADAQVTHGRVKQGEQQVLVNEATIHARSNRLENRTKTE